MSGHAFYNSHLSGARSLVSLTSLLCIAAHAAGPDVSSIDWPKNGTTAVISGASFGSFNGQILSWDDFEHHSTGVNINNKDDAIGNKWTTIYNYNGGGVNVSTEKRVSGTQALNLDWSIDEYSIRAFGWSNKPLFSSVYITYWRNMEGSFNKSSSNHKQFYLYGNNGEFPQLMPLIPGGTDTWGVYNNVGDANVAYSERNNLNTLNWKWENTKERFQRWEVYAVLNSPYTESNGIIKVWLDNKLGVENYSYRTGYVDGKWKDLRIGHMAQGFTSTAKAWFDDVYIATTQARVEACNKPEYTQCDIKHIQYVDPTNWSDNSISFTPRVISLFKDQDVYFYVIDNDGNVSNSIKAPKPIME